MIRVRFSDTDMLALGDDSIDELMDRAEVALDKAVDVVVAEARRNLSRPADRAEGETIAFRQRGRVFSRKGRTAQFTGTRVSGAAAGEPPRLRSGELRDSLQAGKTKRTKYGIRKEYGSDHPAAGLHEFGGSITQGGRKRLYPPRPYLRPAEASTQDEVERILEDL